LSEQKNKPYKMRYAGSRGKGVIITLPFDPRKHKCDACGRRVGEEIKMTAFHHWWYAFQPETVRKNPALALENTSELCYGCHQVADAIRALLYANPSRVANVMRCIEKKYRDRIINVMKASLDVLEKSEKVISDTAINLLKMVNKEDE